MIAERYGDRRRCLKTPEEFAEAMKVRETFPANRMVGSYGVQNSSAMVSPSTASNIALGFFFVFSIFLTCLGSRKLSDDWALANPAKAAIASADVIEYHWARGGAATYRFTVPGTGLSITNRASIDSWDYDDLARGRTTTIKVHYLQVDPQINAPSRGSSSDVPGDIWLVFMGGVMSLTFGAIGCLVWRKRVRIKAK